MPTSFGTLKAVATEAGAPNFQRVMSLPCCYFCQHMQYTTSFWKCVKHDFNLIKSGTLYNPTDIGFMVESVCNDFEGEKVGE